MVSRSAIIRKRKRKLRREKLIRGVVDWVKKQGKKTGQTVWNTAKNTPWREVMERVARNVEVNPPAMSISSYDADRPIGRTRTAPKKTSAPKKRAASKPKPAAPIIIAAPPQRSAPRQQAPRRAPPQAPIPAPVKRAPVSTLNGYKLEIARDGTVGSARKGQGVYIPYELLKYRGEYYWAPCIIKYKPDMIRRKYDEGTFRWVTEDDHVKRIFLRKAPRQTESDYQRGYYGSPVYSIRGTDW